MVPTNYRVAIRAIHQRWFTTLIAKLLASYTAGTCPRRNEVTVRTNLRNVPIAFGHKEISATLEECLFISEKREAIKCRSGDFSGTTIRERSCCGAEIRYMVLFAGEVSAMVLVEPTMLVDKDSDKQVYKHADKHNQYDN